VAEAYGIALKKDNTIFSLINKIKIEGHQVILLMPLTFMNQSGFAVKALLKKYKISLNNLLVICDDLDLDFGRLKIRPSGSSGGHRGLESIIDSLGSKNFPRLRIGIGRPLKSIEPAEYVLSAFSKKEKEQLNEIIKRATECCKIWIGEGIQRSMNIFNRKGAN
jgi:PTH1 family peptidyl-tRNA hydrolase